MNSTLFKNAKLIEPANDTDMTGWLLVEGAAIKDSGSGSEAPKADRVINCCGNCLAPGIVDIGVKVCEPGERHKESYRSAGLAAAAGGVTTIVTRPDTIPAIDSPETLEFVARRAKEASPVNVLPMAALTKRREGNEMTEIGFLLDAGAVAFTDCDRIVANTKVLTRALTYARSLGALVMGHCQEPGLSEGASATSGKFASLRGIPAVSPMAERIGLERDAAMVEMTGASYHFDQITSSLSLSALERAKNDDLDITAGTSIHHLTLNEFDIADYRTFFKVKPPLRAEHDRQAVVQGIRDGLIDIISSMHTPQDEESKRLPFEEAASGAVALETLLPAALRLYHSGDVTLPGLFRALSLNPSRRLGLNSGTLSKGAPADLILFDPHIPFVLDRWKLRSKSKNTPFDGHKMQGKVLMTFVAGVLEFES
ncbi:MAG: dihydroorotase [Roseovarius sp.]|nr:dihydroorotase [Roseovarius sp.]MCY4208899.1 dihydroorotase [Roseovarius sp.]MCY4315001.1 dihydroorotase [Roseovarius sp.]